MTRRALTITGDYAPNVAGRWTNDATQVPNVLLALRTTLGSSLVNPKLGNRSRLTPAKITPTTPRKIEHDYREALTHLTSSGLIWDLTIVSSATNEGTTLETVVSFRDAAGDQTLVL